jgi:type VI protein secretion system component VasA
MKPVRVSRITTPLETSNIVRVFQDCQMKHSEDKSKARCMERITTDSFWHFDPTRLKANTAAINNMAAQLNLAFQEHGGAHFNEMSIDHRGLYWCGDDQVLEELAVMAIATGKMRVVGFRASWSRLPGGLPNLELVA